MTPKSARISVNKLGEYMDANASRRKAIVKAQKKPPGEIVVARYRDAYVVLEEYFTSPRDDLLHRRAAELRADASGTEWARQDRNLSSDALLDCADLIELVNLDGVKIVSARKNGNVAQPVVNGVLISVRPDFLILDAANDSVIGGIKYSFNKSHPLKAFGGEVVATLLKSHLCATYGATVKNEKCLSIATSVKQLIRAPRAFKSRMSATEAACEEIASRWVLES